MRWYWKPKPQNKEYRVVTKFLLFPKTISDETRWLEVATWTEQYVYGGSYEPPYYFWDAVDWGEIQKRSEFY